MERAVALVYMRTKRAVALVYMRTKRQGLEIFQLTLWVMEDLVTAVGI